MSYGVCMVRQAPVICVMAQPIHLGSWSMALMLWLPITVACKKWHARGSVFKKAFCAEVKFEAM